MGRPADPAGGGQRVGQPDLPPRRRDVGAPAQRRAVRRSGGEGTPLAAPARDSTVAIAHASLPPPRTSIVRRFLLYGFPQGARSSGDEPVDAETVSILTGDALNRHW